MSAHPRAVEQVRRNIGERGWLGLTLACAVLLVAINAWWLVASRRGFPVDIDEAGYMTIALNDHAALSHGLGSYLHAVESQYPYAPLVPALTAFVYVVRTSILASFATELAFLPVLAAACYGVARRVLGTRAGALAAIAVIAAPGVITFTREYVFALPSAALLMCAVYALMASDGLRRRGWAVGLGAALGLMLLARTMSIAVAPAVLIAGVARVVIPVGDRFRRTGNLALAMVVAIVVAGAWYLPNLSPVFHYLTDYGYGQQAGEYGSAQSILSWAWWTRELDTLFLEDLFAPLGLLVLIGVAATVADTARPLWRSRDRGAALLAAIGSDAGTVAIVFVGGYLALSSSRNRGTGFALMLVPLLVILAALPLRRGGRALTVVATLTGVVAIVNVVASTDLWRALSQPRMVNLPALGTAPWVDGEGHALSELREQLPGDPTRFVAADRAWVPASRRAAAFLIGYAHEHGREPIVAFGMRNRVFNTNSVQLAARLYYAAAIPVAQLDPRAAGASSAAYASFLADPLYGQPNFVITIDSTAGDYTPIVRQAQAVTAARDDGFTPVSTATLPDGRRVTYWWISRGPTYDPRRGR